ncbi:DsbA family protein [Carnobacterium gallinarum]|uniref:DsbA family protein n=1 Tax=Carnobacterium gallinarum TaxID=2749 RepID=UPI00055274CA|nr:DsbA family protein [Carnobacterium gallinarum]
MLADKKQSTIPTFKRVIEIYLFVNPIGSRCYESEKEVLDFVKDLDQKVHFRFIPFHNFQTITNFMQFNQMPEKNLDLRNKICHNTYFASLAYKAALMQGKKKGRTFLLTLQHELVENNVIFSEALLIQVAEEAKLDIPMFLEDKESDFAKASYEADQRIAREMSIKNNPSMVIFDNENDTYGLLVESCITVDLLKKLCDPKATLKENNRSLVTQTPHSVISKQHLRVL